MVAQRTRWDSGEKIRSAVDPKSILDCERTRGRSDDRSQALSGRAHEVSARRGSPTAVGRGPRHVFPWRDPRHRRAPVAVMDALLTGHEAGADSYTWTNCSGRAVQIGQEDGGWFGSMWPHAGHRKSRVASASRSCVTVASATAQSRARSASS